jgi:hypothetical protein
MSKECDSDDTPQQSHRRQNEESFIHGQIVALCNAGVGEYIGVCAAACEINRLGLVLFRELDEDFKVFAGICSETEDLPIGQERQNWDSVVLLEKDKELRRMETAYNEVFREACKRLLVRFGPQARWISQSDAI